MMPVNNGDEVFQTKGRACVMSLQGRGFEVIEKCTKPSVARDYVCRGEHKPGKVNRGQELVGHVGDSEIYPNGDEKLLKT